MTLTFYKYQGAGNDFIIIDGRDKKPVLDYLIIKKLCDRKFGIGADGLMILKARKGFDFSMAYYNSDGLEGSMCGNGGRCILAYAQKIGITKKRLHFLAIDGSHEGEIINQENEVSLVRLKMTDVAQFKTSSNYYEIDTGSPHYINFTNKLKSKDVFKEGKDIRNNDLFKEKGINVNFVEEAPDYLFVRTYERGVENETLSCGTGVTASALAYAIKNNIEKGNINIKTLGGNLKVSFVKKGNVFKDVWLEGPATFVFKGDVTVP